MTTTFHTDILQVPTVGMLRQTNPAYLSEQEHSSIVIDSKIDIIQNDRHQVEVEEEHPSKANVSSSVPNYNSMNLRDHATLLLSIATIAQSEIAQCPLALQDTTEKDREEEDDDDVAIAKNWSLSNGHNINHHQQPKRTTPALPCFPKCLDSGTEEDSDVSQHQKMFSLSLVPRTHSIGQSILIGMTTSASTVGPLKKPTRLRSVSFDSPTSVMKNILHPWEEMGQDNDCVDNNNNEGDTMQTSIRSDHPPSGHFIPTPASCYTPVMSPSGRCSTKRSTSHNRHNLESNLPKKRMKMTSGSLSTLSSNHPSIRKTKGKKKRFELASSSSSSEHSISRGIPSPTAVQGQHIDVALKQQKHIVVVTDDSNNCSRSSPSSSLSEPPKQMQELPPIGTPVVKVFRRKFSWKNYPPLEEFLIEHRDEYLHHSALNYTMKQKNYNNTLTRDLLSLASTHGYMFDTTDFNFVTVRDRIRCYYKSYVQSSKKRGILIGYAAKKAGLFNPKDYSYCDTENELSLREG